MMRIVKLGGSLLDLSDLVPRLRRWLELQTPMATAIIVGGGELVEEVRDAFARRELDEEAAHWKSIELMGLNAGLFARRMPRAVLVHRLEQLRGLCADARPRIFDVGLFLRVQEPQEPGVKLPYSWDATSDSIAARVAHVLAAAELVLLKSCPAPPRASLEKLSSIGYIDRHFPHAAAGQTVRFVDLQR
jgi:aspartokinase-like uncharacterized kinase